MAADRLLTATFRILIGIGAGLGFSVLAYRFHFNLSAATSIHLFLVVFIARRWGLLEASIVSVFSVACLDYFFTEPVFAFYIADSHDWVALITFEASALLVSQLSNQVIRHAKTSEAHQERLQKLYAFSQEILLLNQMDAMEGQLSERIHSSFPIEGVVIWNALDRRTMSSGACLFGEEEAQLSYRTGMDRDDVPGGTSLRILRSGTGSIGVLVLCGHSLDASSVNAIASLTSIAIEHARSFAAEAHAEAARQSEQLRSAILDGMAHAFKSPLTTIRISSSGLLAMKTLSGGEEKLVGLIDKQAERLSELANHLLLTAKLDRADLKIQQEAMDVVQLIEDCVETCSQDTSGHAIRLQLHTKRSPIHGDAKLLRMSVILVLDNALKYGAQGSPVLVELRETAEEAILTIANQGSFIPMEEREKVFQRFYRCVGSAGKVFGTGIGLSVVRRIVEVHHGSISIESDLVRGTAFKISLPRTSERSDR